MEKGRDHVRKVRPDRVAVEMDKDELKRAAQAPLYDFNFKKDEIPEPLANLKNIYYAPPDPGCRNMKKEVGVLTAILGPEEIIVDDDSEKVLTLNPSGVLESAVTSFIPFSDIIRYVSGASAHEKKLARAYFRGQARRSYLRGWSTDRRCDIPRPMIKPKRTTKTS